MRGQGEVQAVAGMEVRVATRLPLLQTPVVTSRSPAHPHFCPMWLQIGVPTTPSSGLIICFDGCLGKHIYWFIRKDTKEQPGEEVHRERSGRVLPPWSCGVRPSQHVDPFTNQEAL